MKLTLPYPPSLNAYYRNIRGMVLLSREGRAYKVAAGMAALQQRVRKQDGLLLVSVHVFRPQRRGDLDNTAKALLDALNGVAWDDDSQIVELHLYRGDDKANPRVEIDITPHPAVGEN